MRSRTVKNNAHVFTSPADPERPVSRSKEAILAKDVQSPLGYATCALCGHVVGLKRSTFADSEADPPIKYRAPVLLTHSMTGYKAHSKSRDVCYGSSRLPTGPISRKKKESGK